MGKGAHILPSRKAIAILLFFTSGVFLMIGFSFLIDMMLFRNNAIPTKGILTGYVEKRPGNATYSPVFIYNDASGIEYEIESNSSSSSPVGSIGDVVTVYYSNSNPSDARIMDDTSYAFFPISLISVSILELIIGLLLVKSVRKDNHDKDRIYSIV